MLKKLLFFSMTFFIGSLFAQSQDIILNFDAALSNDGSPVSLDKVIVENLTQNTFIELNGPFTTNISQTASEASEQLLNSQNGFKSVYPNPFSEALNIEFYASGNSTQLSVYNLLGQEVAQHSDHFNVGLHQVKFQANSDGLYFVRLNDNGNTYTKKVVATGATNSQSTLLYSSFLSEPSLAKTGANTEEDFFQVGDLLRYRATAGSLRASIYDSPAESKEYTFQFTGDFYKFDPYLIQEEYPAFVNVLFSVTDVNNVGVDYLTNDDFKVLENGSSISASESARFIKKLDQVPYIQRTVLMLDKSRSVRDDLPAIKEAAIALINALEVGQLISVYSFAGTADLLQGFTSNKQALIDAVNSIEANGASTNLYGSILTGLSSYQNSYTLDSIEEGYMVVLTDGNDQANSNTVEEVVAARGNRRIFMVGLGDELTPEPLNKISNPGNYIPISTADNLQEVFEQINLDIIRFSNSFYFLNYLSPKRNSVNDIRLEADPNTNDAADSFIEGSFDSTGFIDVVEGVYVNVEPGSPYGPEDGINVQANGNAQNLNYQFEAVTYFAEDVPAYDWEVTSTGDFIVDFNIDENDNSKLSLALFNVERRGSVTIDITDAVNNYTNTYTININDTFPTVTTVSVTEIDNDAHTAVSGGTNASIRPTTTNSGIVYGLEPNPTLQNNDGRSTPRDRTNDGFSSNLRFLRSNSTYYVRAFLFENSESEIGYGNEVVFETGEGTPLLRILPNNEEILATSIKIRSELIDDGGLGVTERGIVFSKTEDSSNPTLENDKQIITESGSIQETDVINLEPQTRYSFRAYAINSAGIAYSNTSRTLTTKDGIPRFTVPNNPFSQIKVDNARHETRSIQTNGAAILERGVCYGKESMPTVDNATTSDGTGTERYFSQLVDLLPETVYYVRAYARTVAGIGYSDERAFRTLPAMASSGVFRTQSEVDEFVDFGYTAVGSLSIIPDSPSDIRDISGLKALTRVTQDILISGTNFINLQGLENINLVGGTIFIRNNELLTDISALAPVEIPVSKIELKQNALLSSDAVNGLKNLGGIEILELTDLPNVKQLEVGSMEGLNTLTITNLNSLISIDFGEEMTFFESLMLRNTVTKIVNSQNLTNIDNLYLQDNGWISNLNEIPSLVNAGQIGVTRQTEFTDLSMFSNFRRVRESLTISASPSITNLSGLNLIESVGRLNIIQNINLKNLDALSELNSIGSNNGALRITDNSALTDFCGIKNGLRNNRSEEFVITGNAYNPTKAEIIGEFDTCRQD